MLMVQKQIDPQITIELDIATKVIRLLAKEINCNWFAISTSVVFFSAMATADYEVYIIKVGFVSDGPILIEGDNESCIKMEARSCRSEQCVSIKSTCTMLKNGCT